MNTLRLQRLIDARTCLNLAMDECNEHGTYLTAGYLFESARERCNEAGDSNLAFEVDQYLVPEQPLIVAEYRSAFRIADAAIELMDEIEEAMQA